MTPTPIQFILDMLYDANGVSIDSRTIEPNCIFFAIKGAHFDGNSYAGMALDRGAKAAIVDSKEVADQDKRCFWVPNTEHALQQLANAYRKTFNIPVIGVTGSNGKTTTKELLAAVLQQRYEVHYTQGNYNNHLGVPLTLLSMPSSTEIAVVEMGANHQGEIALLSSIAEPTYGVITNIGKAHLEGFGGIEGVKKGKSELYRYLENSAGTAFVNVGEDFLPELAKGVPHIITYAVNPVDQVTTDYTCHIDQVSPSIILRFMAGNQSYSCQTQLFGNYNVQNILTALALGLFFEVAPDAIVKALSQYRPANNRSQQLVQGEVTYLLDAYNANPSSMENALRYFGKLNTPKKKMAILGDMLELGDDSSKEHQRIAEIADTLGFDQLVFVGPQFEQACRNTGGQHFGKVSDLKIWFKKGNWKNYQVLIKASRGLALETIIAD